MSYGTGKGEKRLAEAIENAIGQAVQFAGSGIIADIESNIELMKIGRE